MKHFLLFDSGCAFCTKLAREVEQESNGLLSARSVRDPEIQTMLNTAKPDWKWEPTLLEVSEDSNVLNVFTGFPLRLHLVNILGLREAWRIAKLVYQESHPLSMKNEERRKFLKFGGRVVAGLATLGLYSNRTQAQSASSGNQVFLPFVSSEDGNESQVATVTTLSGDALSNSVNRSFANQDTNTLHSYLANEGYQLQSEQTSAGTIDAKGKDTILFVTIPYAKQDGDAAQIKFVMSDSKTTVGAGLLLKNEGRIIAVDVLEIKNQQVIHTDVLRRNDDDSISLTRSDGTVLTIPNSVNASAVSTSNCSTCLTVCNYVYGLGCGITGFLACNLACLPIANAACPLICTAVYAIICTWQVGWSCNKICGKKSPGLGYC